MNIEDQVCSLGLSKRLKELGVKQESLFYWVKIAYPEETYSDQDKVKEWPDFFLTSYELKKKVYLDKESFTGEEKLQINSYGCGCCGWDMDVDQVYSAFTVAELGEMLPGSKLFNNKYTTLIDLNGHFIKSQKKDDEYKIYIDGIDRCIIFTSKNEANARAAMLIYLIENGFVKVGEL